jgi:hypothetical protein
MLVSDSGAGNNYLFNDYVVFGEIFDVQRHADFIKL